MMSLVSFRTVTVTVTGTAGVKKSLLGRTHVTDTQIHHIVSYRIVCLLPKAKRDFMHHSVVFWQ